MSILKPQTLGERLMYAVRRVEAFHPDGTSSVGTAWSLALKTEKSEIQTLVTNRHVINDAEYVLVYFHTVSQGNLDGQQAFLEIGKEFIIGHPDSDIDLAVILVGPAYNAWLRANSPRSFMLMSFSEDDFVNADLIENLDACGNVTMIGCPSGLWDEKNALPLFRRGVTASHPAIDYNGKAEFLVDIGVFSGSSGSPVVILDQGLLKTSKISNEYSPGQRFSLLGTLWGGPKITEKGQIVVEPVPTTEDYKVYTGVRIHLGYVIKIKQILPLLHLVRSMAAA